MITGIEQREPRSGEILPGGAVRPSGRQTKMLDRPAAIAELRRLRYYLELLGLGFRNAAADRPGGECPRGERIALGIDHPELDVVPFWSSRSADGRIAIPFIDFILSEIRKSLDRLAQAGWGDRSVALVGTGRRIVDRILQRLGEGAGEGARKNPRPGDRFLQESLLRSVCGPGSLLLPIVEQCEIGIARRTP